MNKSSSQQPNNLTWQLQKRCLKNISKQAYLSILSIKSSVQPFFRRLGKYLPARFWLAGPLAFFLALFIMAGLMLWLPHNSSGDQSDSQLYHLIFPTILFPLIWCGCFFYPLLDNDVKRASVIMLALLFFNMGIVAVLMLF